MEMLSIMIDEVDKLKVSKQMFNNKQNKNKKTNENSRKYNVNLYGVIVFIVTRRSFIAFISTKTKQKKKNTTFHS